MRIQETAKKRLINHLTMAKKLKTPHDAFTQLMLEVKDIALSFFIANLPKQLVDQLDWSTLTIADAVVRPEGKKAL